MSNSRTAELVKSWLILIVIAIGTIGIYFAVKTFIFPSLTDAINDGNLLVLMFAVASTYYMIEKSLFAISFRNLQYSRNTLVDLEDKTTIPYVDTFVPILFDFKIKNYYYRLLNDTYYSGDIEEPSGLTTFLHKSALMMSRIYGILFYTILIGGSIYLYKTVGFFDLVEEHLALIFILFVIYYLSAINRAVLYYIMINAFVVTECTSTISSKRLACIMAIAPTMIILSLGSILFGIITNSFQPLLYNAYFLVFSPFINTIVTTVFCKKLVSDIMYKKERDKHEY